MYLSKKHKLLFIAVPRTASNSVQKALLTSSITSSTDTVYSLGSRDMSAIDNYHMRPSTLVKKNLVSPDEFSEYTTFAFVREPLERWVSSIFLARHMGVLDQTQDALTQICGLVRNGESPRPFFGKQELLVKRPDYQPFNYQNFFFHGDTQVVDAYRWEDVETVTNKILSDKLGSEQTVSLPHIQMNPNGTPSQFKEPVESWLPSDCYEKMKAYFAKETAFYESVNFVSD
jgi:hypothetical protein